MQAFFVNSRRKDCIRKEIKTEKQHQLNCRSEFHLSILKATKMRAAEKAGSTF
jgi:hypothetical protein